MASRTEYFRSLLGDGFGDSALRHFTLPSPPFSSASLTFILGFLYGGTLSFSSRKFDLTTSFDIWRGAAFLGVPSLQSEVEDHIESLATPQRAARVYAFAVAPDVKCARLELVIMPRMSNQIDEVWATQIVGDLDYEHQKALVRSVCGSLNHDNVATLSRQVLRLRKRLELERGAWADHIRSMTDAVEEAIIKVLGTNFAGVARSKAFNDLMNGIGFSNDTVEWLLELTVKSLGESNAPAVYDALVNEVLLRDVSRSTDSYTI